MKINNIFNRQNTNSDKDQKLSISNNSYEKVNLAELERIFHTIYSYLNAEDPNSVLHACSFFSIIGSAILKLHYNINAKPIAGTFTFYYDEIKRTQLFFGSRDFISTPNEHHFWIEFDNKILDLTSPLYSRMISDPNLVQKMFLKDIDNGKIDNKCFKKAGDFIFEENIPLTEQLLTEFFKKPAYIDIINICLNWFKSPSKKMSNIKIGALKRSSFDVSLDDSIKVTGFW